MAVTVIQDIQYKDNKYAPPVKITCDTDAEALALSTTAYSQGSKAYSFQSGNLYMLSVTWKLVI
jgi:hypothetical protein